MGGGRRLAAPTSATASSEAASDQKEKAEAKQKADAKLKQAANAAAEAAVVLPTNEWRDKLLRIRHTSAHVMAMAVQRMLFPEVQVTIGPWIDNGFYYDFYNPTGEQFSEGDLKTIQKEMTKIIKEKHPITREEVSREEAKKRIEAINEPYKPRDFRLDQNGAHHHLPHRRPMVGPLCGAPRGDDRGPPGQGHRPAERGRRVLARRRVPRHAAAHLRNGVGGPRS